MEVQSTAVGKGLGTCSRELRVRHCCLPGCPGWLVKYHLSASCQKGITSLSLNETKFRNVWKTSEEWIISMKGIRQKEQGRSSNWILTSYHQQQKITPGQSPSVIVIKCTLKNSFQVNWSLCTLYLRACQVRVTAGDSGLCCCACVMYIERSLTPLCVEP